MRMHPDSPDDCGHHKTLQDRPTKIFEIPFPRLTIIVITLIRVFLFLTHLPAFRFRLSDRPARDDHVPNSAVRRDYDSPTAF